MLTLYDAKVELKQIFKNIFNELAVNKLLWFQS